METKYVLAETLDALRTLAQHPAFEEDAPEFNEGGVGYEAIKKLKAHMRDRGLVNSAGAVMIPKSRYWRARALDVNGKEIARTSVRGPMKKFARWEVRDDLRAYRENEPRTPTRLIRRRVRVLCRWCGKVAEECTGSGYADDIPAHDFKPGL